MREILAPVLADQSALLFSLSKEESTITRKGFWKFNSSLTKEQNYIIQIEKLICNFCSKNESRLGIWEIIWNYY